MYKDYMNHEYDELRQRLAQINAGQKSDPEYLFYRAVFNKNGEEAKEIFQDVFDNGEGRVKALAARKLMDYYYAKGYYLNASKYQKYLIEDRPAVTVDVQETSETVEPERKPVQEERNSGIYYIQVGAFSLEENAEQLIRMLATQNITAKLVERKVNQKKLFCVWLEGKTDFKETFDYANVIKEKYDLKFRIIK